MPAYTIETTYNVPIFRHGTYIVDTSESVCKAAIRGNNWESAKKDYDSSGDIYVTGIWKGEKTHYAGSSVAIDSQFDDAIQRRVLPLRNPA